MPKIPMKVTCKICGETHLLNVEPADRKRWLLLSRPARYFFPYLSTDELYLIDNNICAKCAKEHK